ncbi:MAG: enoyl-CoA hydratase/isomerase family protein [Actinomycetota bacterium]
MAEELVLRPAGDGVVVVELHRPHVRNAMDAALVARLSSALVSLARDPTARALVLTGAGGAFSSGADLGGTAGPAQAGVDLAAFARLYERAVAFPRPLVAAVAGACVGAGAEIAACCDLRVGTPSAAIRFPGARFGVPVGPARLPALIGVSHAKDLLMTSRTVGGEEAFRMGFLNRLVPEAELEAEAVSLAALLAAQPGAPSQKRLVDEVAGLTEAARAESRRLGRWGEAPPGRV